MRLHKYWKVLSLLLLALTIVIFIIQKINTAKVKPLPTLTTLSELVPGETKVSQLQDLPSLYHQDSLGNEQRLLVGQNSPQGYSEITAQDNTVIAVKKTNPQEFEFAKLSEYIQKYGNTSWNIQTPWSEFGYLGYVYPSVGRVIIAHPQSGEVIEEWFVPINVDGETINLLFPPLSPTQGS